MDIKTSAFHENATEFGPCEGPMFPDKGASWFCRGNGTGYVDPASREFDLVILCYPCFSMRESTHTMGILNDYHQPELETESDRVLCGHCDAMAPMATCVCAEVTR